MVTVIDFKVRTNSDAEEFIVLILQGDLEMVKSKEGKYYATAKRASCTSTFTEETAQKLVGKSIPGRIIRQSCSPYEYVIPESGEVLEMNYRWGYTPEEQSAPEENQNHFYSKQSDTVSLVENGQLQPA